MLCKVLHVYGEPRVIPLPPCGRLTFAVYAHRPSDRKPMAQHVRAALFRNCKVAGVIKKRERESLCRQTEKKRNFMSNVSDAWCTKFSSAYFFFTLSLSGEWKFSSVDLTRKVANHQQLTFVRETHDATTGIRPDGYFQQKVDVLGTI